jgi:hypothetical protein
MGGAAAALGALGLALLFAPDETSIALAWGGGVVAPSVAAGGFLALAVLNWMGRGAIYGGIYGRPIVLANLTFALTAGLALFNHQTGPGPSSPLGWIPVAILAFQGVVFGRMLMGRGSPPAP